MIEAPPSTSEAVPVTNDNSSGVRQGTERASASGFAMRLRGCRPVTSAYDAWVSFMSRDISVSTAPGNMTLTRASCAPYSAASVRVKPIRPAWLAAKTAVPGNDQRGLALP